MPRRFYSPTVRPAVYNILAALFALVAFLIDSAFIPARRYSPDYFLAIAAFALPALAFLYLAERSRRRSN